jgi:hypothetical protein
VNANGCPVERFVEYMDPWMPDMWHEIREEAGRITFDFETDYAVTIALDQEWFLNNYMMFYSFPSTTMDFNIIPEQIVITTRVRTVSTVSGRDVSDIIDLRIRSNQKDWSDMCVDAFAALTLKANSGMGGARTWDVPKSGEWNEADSILITPKVEGIESMMWTCQEQLHMTIDIQYPGEVWRSIFNERDPMVYSELMGLHVMYDGNFHSLLLEIDEMAFVNDWAVIFPVVDNKITL